MALGSDLNGPEGRKKRHIIWVIVTCSVIVTAVCLAVSVLHNYIASLNILNYNDGDIVNVKDDVSDFNTVLCQGYKVDRLTAKADVYMLPFKAKVDIAKTKKWNYTYTALDLYSDSYHRAFYLLHGSSLTAAACWTDGASIKVLILKGKTAFSTWASNRACSSCIWKNATVNSSTNCSAGQVENVVGVVTAPDNYYIVIVRTKTGQKPYPWSYFTVNLVVRRTVYDVSDFTEVCLANQPDCTLNLTYNTNPDLIADFHHSSFSPEVTVMTSCEPRVLFWLGLMFILPMVLMLLCTVAVYVDYHFCSRRHEYHSPS